MAEIATSNKAPVKLPSGDVDTSVEKLTIGHNSETRNKAMQTHRRYTADNQGNDRIVNGSGTTDYSREKNEIDFQSHAQQINFH